ncbi:serine/threonine protein phosphatase [Chitinophaga sp. Cy-1792]|nr:serine/threonine protein phosphatase [Chitinophaga sp. Cy-1792]
MSRTIAIGDIHGGLSALEQVIALLNPLGGDRLIFLGDYVDGWSESAQVIDYLLQLEQSVNCIFIKGNHDVQCELWLSGALPDEEWAEGSGAATIESYAGYSDEQRGKHLDFFRRTRYYFVDEQNRLFVHGGFTADDGPAAEPFPELLTRDRSLLQLAFTLKDMVLDDPAWLPEKMAQFKGIYIGHTPTINYHSFEPVHACNLWDIDTGAGFYGPLTAMDIDTEQVYQSKPLPDLYPDEQGRNSYLEWEEEEAPDEDDFEDF